MRKLGGLLLVGLMLGEAQTVWPCSPPYEPEVIFLTDDARWQSQGLQLIAESYDGKIKDYLLPGTIFSMVQHQMDGDGTVLAYYSYDSTQDGFLLVDKRGVRSLRAGLEADFRA